MIYPLLKYVGFFLKFRFCRYQQGFFKIHLFKRFFQPELNIFYRHINIFQFGTKLCPKSHTSTFVVH